MRTQGPLANCYPAAAALVIFALVPYLGLTSAVTPLSPMIARQVGLSPQALQLTDGMANAGGMLLLAGGAAVLSGVATAPHVVVIVGSGLVGLGVGASVSPALFMAGFSIRSTQIQRVFALIELLRGVAAFLVAPVILHLAMTVAKTPAAGTPVAMWRVTLPTGPAPIRIREQSRTPYAAARAGGEDT